MVITNTPISQRQISSAAFTKCAHSKQAGKGRARKGPDWVQMHMIANSSRKSDRQALVTQRCAATFFPPEPMNGVPAAALTLFGKSTRSKGPAERRNNQRNCNPKGIVSSSSGLRGTSYLGPQSVRVINPKGVASRFYRWVATPLGLVACGPGSQGSSCLATLGFGPESRWDSVRRIPKPISHRISVPLNACLC